MNHSYMIKPSQKVFLKIKLLFLIKLHIRDFPIIIYILKFNLLAIGKVEKKYLINFQI